MPITNSSGNNRDIVNKLEELLIAFNSLKFNQPPLLTTSPPPQIINFLPGEIKEIIPATNSPRRIIIKSLSGEIKLLLGTDENIELSAITVDANNLVDERWQGKIFGYSEKGGAITINLEQSFIPPSAKNDETATVQNQSVTLNILSNDSDPDGSITGIDLDINTLDMQNTASTSQGIFSVDNSGELIFTPAAGFLGTASLNYQVFDNSGATDEANIYIAVDGPPPLVATNDNYADRKIISGEGIWYGTNRNATYEPNEDEIASGGLQCTVWFEWTPLVNEWHRINIRPASSESSDPDFYMNMKNNYQGWSHTTGNKTIYGKRSPTSIFWLLIDSKVSTGDFELEIVIEPL